MVEGAERGLRAEDERMDDDGRRMRRGRREGEQECGGGKWCGLGGLQYGVKKER